MIYNIDLFENFFPKVNDLSRDIYNQFILN